MARNKSGIVCMMFTLYKWHRLSPPAFFPPHFVSLLYVVGWSYSLFLWTAELNSILWAFHSLLFCFPGRTFSSSQQCCYKQPRVREFPQGLQARGGFLGLIYTEFSETRWLLAWHRLSSFLQAPRVLVVLSLKAFTCSHNLSGSSGHLSFQPLVSWEMHGHVRR